MYDKQDKKSLEPSYTTKEELKKLKKAFKRER